MVSRPDPLDMTLLRAIKVLARACEVSCCCCTASRKFSIITNEGKQVGQQLTWLTAVQRIVIQSLKPTMPDTWEVDVKSLQFYKDRRGNPLQLGHGASGKVQ